MSDRYQITVELNGRDNLSDDLRAGNQQLQRFGRNAENAGNSASDASGGMNALGGAVGAAAAAFGAMEIGQRIVDLNNLGTRVSAVRTTFNQLSGGADAARTSLANMQDLTGGVVDNMTLMEGANSVLLTGLADTNDQAAELVNLGVRLSAAMGVDAKEGIENLNAALLNNSYARLDTLGISAAAVRERVNELKEAELDMSAAFSQAVLEQGREKIELLGDAANTSETALNRLETRFENMTQSLSLFVAEGVEAGAQLTELAMLSGEIGLGNVVGLANGETREGQLNAERVDAIRDERLGENFGLMQDTRYFIEPQSVVNFSEQNPDLFNRVSSGSAFTNAAMGASDATITEQTGLSRDGLNAIMENISGQDFGNMRNEEMIAFATELDTQLSALNQVLAENDAAAARAAESQEQLNDALALASERSGEYSALEERRLANVEAANRASSEEQALFESLNGSYEGLLSTANEFENIGGIEIMNPDDAAEIINTADSMQARFETLKDLADETDFQYVSEDELAWAESLASHAGELAEQAQAAADAFEQMSLNDLFGQGGGGRIGQLSDLVLENVDSPEQREALEREFNLNSGRETDISVAFEEQFAPLLAQITTEQGTDEGIAATERALATLEEGRLVGMSSEDLVDAITIAIGMTRDENGELTQSFSDSTLDPALQPLAEAGVAEGESFDPAMMGGIMALTGGGMGAGGEGEEGEGGGGGLDAIQEQLILIDEQALLVSETVNGIASTDLSGVLDPFIHAFEITDDYADRIKSKLDAMANKTFRTNLVIDVAVNDPSGMGNSVGFSDAMATATANNGGSPPGTGPQ